MFQKSNKSYIYKNEKLRYNDNINIDMKCQTGLIKREN